MYSVKEAAQKATIIQILIPDTLQTEVYKKEIQPHLSAGKAIVFSHGFNIHFDLIQPEASIDVYMIAPKSPRAFAAQNVCRKQRRSLFNCHPPITIQEEQKPGRWPMREQLAQERLGFLKLLFKKKQKPIFLENRLVLCGGVTSLIKSGFETLVEAGYAPEIAYFECLHELKLIVDLINEGGLEGMRYSISDTAEYGDLTRGSRIVDGHVKNNMKKILNEIQKSKGGSFAKEWVEESKNNYPNFKRRIMEEKNHPVEKVGRKLRSMMTWLQ